MSARHVLLSLIFVVQIACVKAHAPLDLKAHREPEFIPSAVDRAAVVGPVNEIRSRSTLSTSSAHGSFHWPVRGLLYARFGIKGAAPHDGIDLAAPLKTPVVASATGTVLFAGEQKGYGLLVVIEHDEGMLTLYAQNDELLVKAGQEVTVDDQVSTVGTAGASSSPHLHFEIRKNGKPVDPLLYLAKVPALSDQVP